MSSFNFDTKYGKQALDEVLSWISHTMEVSIFRDIERSESFTTELIYLIINDVHVRKWLTASIHEEELARMLEMKPVPFALLSKVWLYNVGIDVTGSDKIDVRRFLNRILGLEVEKQNLLFNVFLNRLDVITRSAKRDGTYDTGVKELIGGRVYEKTRPEVVYEANQMQTLLHTIEVDRGIAWPEILLIYDTTAQQQTENQKQPGQEQKLQDFQKKSRKISSVKLVKSGFYLSKRGFQGRHFIIYAKEKDDVFEFQTSNIICYRPQTGKHELLRSSFYDKYEKINFNKSEQMWTSEYDLNTKRVVTWHMLSGAVLPIWKAIASTLQVTKGPVRIMRALLDVHADDTSTTATTSTTTSTATSTSNNVEEDKDEMEMEDDEKGDDGGKKAAVIGIWLPNLIMEDVSILHFSYTHKIMTCQSVCQSVCLSVCLLVYLSASLSFCLSVYNLSFTLVYLYM